MAYDIGTARGVIEMMYNGRGVATAKADLTALERGAAGAQKVVTGSMKAMGLGGFALASAIAYVIHTNAQFEKQLSGIQAVSGATAGQMDLIRSKALQLGKDTVFSATEAASAMEELVKAGISVDDVLHGAADAAVALAAAGGISIPEAATIAANSMNQFGLSAAELPGVVDDIAGAANASAIDVSDMGQSLQQVGAVAHLAGLDFNDTATAIALMGNAGIRGSDAGTSLKSMLQRLQPATKKQANEMKALGLITADGSNKFFDAQGNIKSYADIAGVLSNSLKGMTQQQKLAALQTLFGSDAIRGAAIAAEAGRKGVQDLNDEMHKTTAADVAATRMDNFSGSLEQLKGSLETAIILGGSAALPVLRDFVDWLTRGVNAAPKLAGQLKDELGPGFHDLVDAIGDVIRIGMQVIDMFGGIIAIAAKLGLGTVIGVFTVLAQVLDTVTGLLDGQGAVLAIALGAWILLANGGIGVVIARLGYFAAYAVIKALDGLIALQGGATSTMASLRALAAGAAAASASIAAVALVVAAIVIWNAYKQAVKETQDALEAASKAQSSGNFAETQAGLEAINKEIAKRKALIENVDVTNIKDTGKFLENAFNPSRWGDVAKMGEFKDSMGDLEDQADALKDTLLDMGGSLSQLLVTLGSISPEEAASLMDGLSRGDPGAIEDMNQMLTDLSPLLEQAGFSQDEFSRALANSGTLLGSINFQLMADQLRAVASTSDTAAGGQQTLAAAAAAFADQAISAEDAAKLLKAALDNLIGVQLGADEAGIKWRESLEKLRKELKISGDAMFANTAAGDANKQLVIDATASTLDRVEAEAKAGTSIGAITKMFKSQREEIIKSAGPTKAAQDAMRAYLGTLNFTPKAIRTLVEAVGIDRAQKHVEKLTEKYHLTPEQVTTIFKAAGATSASAQVKALRDYIKQLKGKDAPVNTPGAKDSNQQIKDLEAKIKVLKGKDAKIGTPGAAEAAAQVQNLKDKIDALRDRQVTLSIITRHLDIGGGGTGGGQQPATTDPTVPRMLPGAQHPPQQPHVGTLPPKKPYSAGTSGRSSAGAADEGGGRGSLRLIRGRLTLDDSGRAFIRGIAEEVVDDAGSYDDTRDRMN
jgi:TP901 family phage tail tape measure protein